jgi:hypothetical protein
MNLTLVWEVNSCSLARGLLSSCVSSFCSFILSLISPFFICCLFPLPLRLLIAFFHSRILDHDSLSQSQDLTQAGVTVEPFFISTGPKSFDVSKFYAVSLHIFSRLFSTCLISSTPLFINTSCLPWNKILPIRSLSSQHIHLRKT